MDAITKTSFVGIMSRYHLQWVMLDHIEHDCQSRFTAARFCGYGRYRGDAVAIAENVPKKSVPGLILIWNVDHSQVDWMAWKDGPCECYVGVSIVLNDRTG